MGKIIPIAIPQVGFDFDQESLTAAINEACNGAAECNFLTPCEECRALAIAIRNRLNRAYLAGQASMITRLGKEEDGNE